MTLFHPTMTRPVKVFALVQVTALLAATAVFLWLAGSAPWTRNALWLATLLAACWAAGAALQGRISLLMALMVQCGALATATSALGLVTLYGVFKPLAMIIAIFLVAISAYQSRVEGLFDLKTTVLLLAALAGSLAGDVFLLFKGLFIPGLVSFLIAHLFYIALFKDGQRWFAHRGVLAATVAAGLAMYVFLWAAGLPPALRAPVAAYVLAIALMAAQAIGRATVLRDRASFLVAVGSAFFMLSDSLLATHRFVQPLPYSQVWVLGTYYAAQCLIVAGWLGGAHQRAATPRVTPRTDPARSPWAA